MTTTDSPVTSAWATTDDGSDDAMEVARDTVRAIVLSSATDEQVVARLTAAGFDGAGATLTPIEAGPAYLVRVEVAGPDGRTVTAF